MMHWGYEWGMGFGGWFLMMVFSILVIVGIVYLIGLIGSGWRKGPSRETPLDILKRRYASGEISREEFEKMKEDLQK